MVVEGLMTALHSLGPVSETAKSSGVLALQLYFWLEGFKQSRKLGASGP